MGESCNMRRLAVGNRRVCFRLRGRDTTLDAGRDTSLGGEDTPLEGRGDTPLTGEDTPVEGRDVPLERS